MAVIAILSAILLPVLGGVLRSGEQAESLNRMRQIGQWMQLYAQDSNDVVLPSRFDYREQRFAGKAASLPNTRFDISSSDIAPLLVEAPGLTFFGCETAKPKRTT